MKVAADLAPKILSTANEQLLSLKLHKLKMSVKKHFGNFSVKYAIWTMSASIYRMEARALLLALHQPIFTIKPIRTAEISPVRTEVDSCTISLTRISLNLFTSKTSLWKREQSRVALQAQI